MAECEICGSHTHTRACSYCGTVVCNDHRLPENHECDNIAAAAPPRAAQSQQRRSLRSLLPSARVLLIGVLLAGAAFVAVSGGDGGGQAASSYNESVVAEAAIERVNDARAAEDLPPLAHSPRASERAAAWSTEMADRGDLTHGEINCRPGAENVAMTLWRGQIETNHGTVYHDDSGSVGRGLANQWLNSSAHRANIMDRQFRAVGIGLSKDGDEIYATQRLCG